MERRTLLGALPILVSTGMAVVLGAEVVQDQAQYARLSDKQKQLMEETRSLRAVHGLTGYSDEVATALKMRNGRWQLQPEPFTNNFPSSLRSHGELARFFSDTVFTPQKAPFIISGAEVNITNPYQYAFHMQSRILNFSHNAGLNYGFDYDPLGNSSPGFLAHEIAGHGTDTTGSITEYSPLDVFIHMEHGKWLMQSQMPYVTGPLTEGPAWRPNQWLPYDMGQAAGRKYVETGELKSGEPELWQRILANLAKDQTGDPHDLRFNKAICTALGRRILRELHGGRVVLDEELQQKNIKSISRSLPETYAEMMMAVLVNPDLINNNPSIIAGGQEVISAIRGDDVSLDVIRARLRRIPLHIQKMHTDELAQIPVAPPTIAERMVQADAKTIRNEGVFEKVLEKGSFGLPNNFKLLGKDRELFAHYLDMVAAVCSWYPELTNLVAKPRSDFDPKRYHSWNTELVEKALNPQRIRDYIEVGFDPNPLVLFLSDDLRQEISGSLEVLDQFKSSDAFGT